MKHLKTLSLFLLVLVFFACNNPKSNPSEVNIIDSLKTANKESADKLAIVSNGPGMSHNISFNVAAFLMQNYNPLKSNVGDSYSEKYGIGGFFSKSTLEALSKDTVGITTFLCLDTNNQFYIAAIEKYYNPNCGSKKDACGISDDESLYKTSNNLRNTYGGNGNPDFAGLKAYLGKQQFVVSIDNKTDTWANIKLDVERFDKVFESKNKVWCNYLSKSDIDSLNSELGQYGMGVFCTLGYDGSEDKNQYRLIFFQVDSTGKLGTDKKKILERMWP